MHSNQSSALEKKEQSTSLVLTMVITLFFLWALTANLLPVLIPHLKKAFHLSILQSSLIDASYWLAYLVIAIPAGMLVRRLGYKKVIIMGLLLAATGAGLFYPAAVSMSFAFFLFALFVLASGMTFLETAANPIITILGPAKTASLRLNFAQAFNGLGAFVASMFLSKLIIGKNVKTDVELHLLSAQNLNDYYLSLFHKVKLPYLMIGAILLLMALVFALVRFPDSTAALRKNPEKPAKLSLRQHPHLFGGLMAQFFYVGAQVCVSSFFILYVTSTTSITEYEATNYLGILLFGFMIGRYFGAFLIRYISAGKLLSLYAVVNAILMLFIVLVTGRETVYLFIAVEFFMSIMYPTIFSLAIKGQGDHTPIASSYMVMSIIGGALFPLLLGFVADKSGSIQIGYLVPMLCFLPVAWFGWKQNA